MTHFLASKTAKEVKAEGMLLIASQHSTVADALKVMGSNGVDSLPVRSGSGYLGFVDTMSLLKFIVDEVTKSSKGEDLPSAKLSSIDIGDLSNLSSKVNLAKLSEESSLVSLSKWIPITTESSLDMAVILFGKGIHRLPVTHASSGILVDIVSQSDLIRYLALNFPGLGDVRKRTVKSLKLGSRMPEDPVDSVQHHTKAIDAFYKMLKANASGLPMVNSKGVLVGNISASDLLSIRDWKFNSLLMSLNRFLSEVCGIKDRKPISVTEEATLQKVVEIMASEGISRVHVVDKESKLIGTITATDVFGALTRS